MEKEQNTNSDKQNKEAEEKINEEQNNDAQTNNSTDSKDDKKEIKELTPVSYTHLTLPTIRSV